MLLTTLPPRLLLALVPLATDGDDGFVGPPLPPELAAERAAASDAPTCDHVFDDRISLHRPSWVAMGRNDLKMQLSFKYRFVRDVPAYVGFSSVIAWDVYEPSFPYRDINFNPELFYRLALDEERGLALDLGYWHNSNGRDGPDSRAWDRLVARGIVHGRILGRELRVAPALYTTLDTDQSNSDVEEFLGVWDLDVALRDVLTPGEPGGDVDLLLRVVGGRGSYQLGLQYKLDGYRWNPHFYAQLFSGYGDTLLEYDERRTELRFGLSFFE